MASYKLSDEGFSEIIQADDMAAAIAQAEESWQNGSWDETCIVSVRVAELDDDGDETGEVDWVNVACGEDEPAPDCTDDDGHDGHDWQSPHEVVGGLDSNPGVWSTGGTTIVTRQVCSCCGLYRRETSYGSQRNPGQCDNVEYLPADEKSLEWVGELETA